jgi:hypothetical protein
MTRHASIESTVDTDGKWLPIEAKVAVNRPDEGPAAAVEGSLQAANGGSMVTNPVLGARKGNDGTSESPVIAAALDGGPHRTRTCGPLIKSQLLYQLS